jgi:hypothetical protein
MFTDRAIAAIRRSLIDAYKKEFKQRLNISTDDVYEELESLIRPDEL